MRYVDMFIKNLDNNNKSELTIKNYECDFKRFFDYIQSINKFSSMKEEEIYNNINLMDLEDYITFLNNDGGRNNKGEAPTTINRRIASLKSLFKYLKKHGVIQTNYTLELEHVKEGKRSVVYLTIPEAQELIAASKTEKVNGRKTDFTSIRNQLMIKIYVQYGLRNTELINLTEKDFDLSNKQMRILGKGNKERFIYLSNSDIELYNKYIKIRNEEIKIKDNEVFLSTNGRRLDIVNVGRIVKNCMNETHISNNKKEKITPHKLRHTAATSAIKSGIPLKAVSELLGHEDTAITQKIYIHIDDEDIRNACSSISSLYS